MSGPASPGRSTPEPEGRDASPERSPERLQPSAGPNWRLAGLGMELAAAVVGGCLLGYWIDRRFGTTPWWFLICTAIGLIGGLYNLIRQAMQETGFTLGGGRRRPRGPDSGSSTT